MPKKKLEIFLTNVARRWKTTLESTTAKRIVVLSPYITSTTAENVLMNVKPQACSIYTVFSAENFGQGSSSLRTLKKLHQKGVMIYHLPKLHAKAVVTDNEVATVGSQNLTLQGTKNREATVFIFDRKQINSILRSIDQWIQDAQIISTQMIADMENILPSLRKLFRNAQSEASINTENIFRAESNRIRVLREEALRIEKEYERKKQEKIDSDNANLLKRKSDLDELIAKLPRISNEVYGSVKNSVFVPKGHHKFTEWTVAKGTVSLQRTFRYFCVMPDVGKLAWVRVMNGRLSFIQRGMQPLGGVQCEKTQYKLDLYATWPSDAYSEGNLKITFSRSNNLVTLICDVWFGIDKLSVITHKSDNMSHSEVVAILAGLYYEQSTLRQRLLDVILNPFKYQKKLTGDNAGTFFGYNTYRMTIHEISPAKRVLIAARYV